MAIRNKGHYLVFQMERALLIIEKSDLAKDAVMSIQFLRFWSGPKFIQSWAWSETGKGAVLSFTKVPNCTWSGAIQKWRGKHGYKLLWEKCHNMRNALIGLKQQLRVSGKVSDNSKPIKSFLKLWHVSHNMSQYGTL